MIGLAYFTFMYADASAQTLTGFASLPADTFAPGPTSGQLISAANGRVPPFVNRQPVQGFSSVLQTAAGDFLAMSDNGFGAQPNSPDYVLRVYRVAPDFRTKAGGTGQITVLSFVTLRDPLHKISFPIVADGQVYPGTAIPVDPSIRQQRLLTGGDFDIESFRAAHDGTLWFGDEFGPFLVHTDATGVVLEAPYPLSGVRSPQTLYPMLEGSLTTDPDQRRLIINEFNIDSRRYTGQQWFYRLEVETGTGQAIGDFTAVSDRLFLVIERDNFEGIAAQFKKIFILSLDDVDANGYLVKHEVVDLLNVRDPDSLASDGTFAFPFQTIESVIPLSQREIGVLNEQ
jgi:hypothetical protein